MIWTIEKVSISDKNKDWSPRINRNWDPYKMISICVEWVRASKYWDANFQNPNIEEWTVYDIELEENWQYMNIKSIKTYINKEFMRNIVYNNLLEEWEKELWEFLYMEIDSCVDEAQALWTIALHLWENWYKDRTVDLITKIM